MKRFIMLAFLFLLSFNAAAGERFYLGFGIVKSDSNLGLQNEVQEFITKEGFQEEVAILESLGAPLRIDDEFTSYGGKIFLGVRMGKKRRWAFELAYVDFGNYKGSVATTLNLSIEGETEVDGSTVEGVLTAVADGELAAHIDLTAISTTFLYSFPVSKRVSFFPRFGLAKMKGDIMTSERFNASANIDADVDGIPMNENGQASGFKVKHSEFEAVVPVIGIGFDVQVKKNWLIRTEYERYGHPTQEPSINFWAISGIRRF